MNRHMLCIVKVAHTQAMTTTNKSKVYMVHGGWQVSADINYKMYAGIKYIYLYLNIYVKIEKVK